MFDANILRERFEHALEYGPYLATGTPEQRSAWERVYADGAPTAAQAGLLAGFTREMHVLVCSGIWCGDCVQQCPLLARLAATNPDRIRLRFFDRDAEPGFSRHLRICGGGRVPVAVFAAEDFEFVSLLGDRTLPRYRALAARQLGPACPLPGAAPPAEETAAVRQAWLDEFERVQLLLRLSTRLRQRHGD